MANLIEDTENLFIIGAVVFIAWLVWKFKKFKKSKPWTDEDWNRVFTGDPTVSAGEDLKRWWNNFFGTSEDDKINDLAPDAGTIPASYITPTQAQLEKEIDQANQKLNDFITTTRNDPGTLPFF